MSMTGDHSGWRVDDEAHFQHDDQSRQSRVDAWHILHKSGLVPDGFLLGEDSSCDLFNIAQESGTAERDKK